MRQTVINVNNLKFLIYVILKINFKIKTCLYLL